MAERWCEWQSWVKDRRTTGCLEGFVLGTGQREILRNCILGVAGRMVPIAGCYSARGGRYSLGSRYLRMGPFNKSLAIE